MAGRSGWQWRDGSGGTVAPGVEAGRSGWQWRDGGAGGRSGALGTVVVRTGVDPVTSRFSAARSAN